MAENQRPDSDGQGLPLEGLQSLEALNTASRETVAAITDFNASEFALHHAPGWPIEAESLPEVRPPLAPASEPRPVPAG